LRTEARSHPQGIDAENTSREKIGYVVSGRSPKNARETVNARADAWRDYHIAELERSQRHLQHLYDISKLLTRFQTVERTVPEVVVLIADTLGRHGTWGAMMLTGQLGERAILQS